MLIVDLSVYLSLIMMHYIKQVFQKCYIIYFDILLSDAVENSIFNILCAKARNIIQFVIPRTGLFQIPTFAFDVALTLRERNAKLEKNSKRLVAMEQKHDISAKPGFAMYGLEAYPTDKGIAMVTEAVLAKHPYFKEA